MAALVNAWLSPFFCDAYLEHVLTKSGIKSELVILRRAGSPCPPKKSPPKKSPLNKRLPLLMKLFPFITKLHQLRVKN
jgi:hypothetical protein